MAQSLTEDNDEQDRGTDDNEKQSNDGENAENENGDEAAVLETDTGKNL